MLLGGQEHAVGYRFHHNFEQINFELPCAHEAPSSRDSY